MRIEIFRGESRKDRPTVLLIDGKPVRMKEAAQHLGLTAAALQKRLWRGSSLARPFQVQMRGQ